MPDDKETSLAAVTDDSCKVKYIEIIIPLARASVAYSIPEFIERVVEVEPEDLQDVEQEPADENDSVGADYSVKVRF